MGLIPRILSTWRGPGRAVRGMAEMSEPAILALLLGTMGIYFVAQWPGHARAAALDASVPLDARIGGALMGTMFLMPLIVMGVGTLVAALLRATGAHISGRQSRLALVWALAAVSPVMLLAGLVQGLAGDSAGLVFVHALVGAAFVIFWAAGLRALVQKGRRA